MKAKNLKTSEKMVNIDEKEAISQLTISPFGFSRESHATHSRVYFAHDSKRKASSQAAGTSAKLSSC